MQVKIIGEYGYEQALLGLSLSHNRDVEEMPQVANKLYCRDDSEAKFLRQMCVWIDVTAPRYFWQQLREYKYGMEWQSTSTMHTLMKGVLSPADFSDDVNLYSIDTVNSAIRNGNFAKAKANLPEGFLQRRIAVTNYQTLRRIIGQRRNHKLPEWQVFINAILEQVEHKEFFADLL